MRSAAPRVRARKARSTKSFRPRPAALEDRVLLSYGVPGDVLTYHNDNGSTGQNLSETTLTPSNVNSASFGKLFTDPVDGYVYAQPLTVSSVPITAGPDAGTTHNVVYVATEHDSLYAFDANTGAQLWQKSFIPAGSTTVPSADTETTDIVPEVGITATPVIDPNTGTLYLVAKTKTDLGNSVADYKLTLYAVDITSGVTTDSMTIADTTFNSSTGAYTYVSGPTVPGTGDNSVDGIVHMNALRNNVRSGLTLANGQLYIGFTSHGDNRPYQGWLLGFDPSTLQPTAVFDAAPNGSDAAIWAAGGKPVVDDNGNIYVSTGNGTFDAAPNGAQSLGGNGGNLGYVGIGDSVAVSFRAYQTSVSGLATDGGAFTNETSTAPVDFQGNSGANPPHTYQATLAYDGTTLNETITDTNTGAVFTKSYTVNIPQQVGGTTAYVGFTGGSGGLTAIQDVTSWTYTSGSTTIDHSAGFASHSDLVNNGNATFNGTAAQLTDGGGSEAGSIFTNAQVPVGTFTTKFTFQMKAGSNPIADGMTFTIQDNPGGPDYGDSILKISPNGTTVPGASAPVLPVTDFFTPFNQAALNAGDVDQGSGGEVLLPPAQPGGPPMLVQTGKSGNIYLLDTDNMGGYNPNGVGPNNVAQELPGAIAGGGSYDTPAYYNGNLYYLGDGDVLKEFAYANGLLSTSPVAQTSTVFGFPGATPSISANGSSDGIVWVLNDSHYGIPAQATAGPAVLYAYDASTLQQLYSSNDVTGRDTLGNAVKFTVPTVSHGMVYVGSQDSFSAFGLFPAATSPPSAPKSLNATAVSSSENDLSWTNTATNATEIEIDRSSDGSNFAAVALVAPGTTSFSDTGLTPSTKYTYQVAAVNQLGASQHSNTANATTLVGAPTLTVSDVLASQINLSWTPTAGSTYEVDRSTDGVNFTQVAKLPNTVTSYSDTGLTFDPNNGTTYFYRVVAFDSANNSATSNVVNAHLGPIVSHVDHSGGFASNSDLTANGSATFTNNVARLTDGGGGEAGTFFTNTQVGVGTFNTTFTFRQYDGSNPEADGLTFIIQGNSPTALGPSGGGLGYGPDAVGGSGGIPNSIAVKFDLFSNNGEGTNSTGLFIDGDSPTIPTSSRDTLVKIDPTVINLHSQDVMMATLGYDGTTLTETITDTVTGKSFTTQYTVNIPAIVGGLVAYAGFGGGTGGLTATQDIQTWKYDSVEDTTKIHSPSGLTVASVDRHNNNTSDITIDWKANNDYNATGFTVQRSTDGTNFSTIATLSPNVDTYTDGSLAGGTYYYRVQAFNATTTSAFSNVDSALIGGGSNPVVIDHSGGFASNGDLTANGSTSFATSGSTTVARLNDGKTGANESGTDFTTSRVGIASFNTNFTFQLHGGTAVEGDGITFIIQGNSPTALGPGGGGLGYGPDTPGGSGGLPNSIAVKFDTFNNAGEGPNSTGLYLDGASPTVPAVNLTGTGIDLHSQDVFQVNLSYDGTTLTETITDTKTQATFTTSYTVNIPTAVGSNVAYVGFGGGTGGNTAVQDIQTWTYTTLDPGQPGGNAQVAQAPAATAPAAVAAPLTAPSTDSASSTTIAGASPPATPSTDPASTAPVAAVIPQSLDGTAAVDAVLGSYPETPKSRTSALIGLATS